MKIYSKRNEIVRNIIAVSLVFMLGFASGVMANKIKIENTEERGVTND